MNALLELPEIRQRVARISVEDYHRLGERPVELLRGTIVEKMSKSPAHFTTVEDLREILTGQIQPGYLLRTEGPLTFTDSEPEPDLCIVKGTKSDFRKSHPTTAELVIEVAVSSLEIDRVKAHIYAEAGIPEYWIVRPDEKCVEVYRTPSTQGYPQPVVFKSPAALESSTIPGIQLDLERFFA
jgi:Uma2 family endonuclease